MSDYKNDLLGLLREGIAELYSGSLVCSEMTQSGFYGDFDLPEPLNPEKVSAIDNWLSGQSCFVRV